MNTLFATLIGELKLHVYVAIDSHDDDTTRVILRSSESNSSSELTLTYYSKSQCVMAAKLIRNDTLLPSILVNHPSVQESRATLSLNFMFALEKEDDISGIVNWVLNKYFGM